MYFRKFLSYATVFMLGFYLGSGGCIDRILGQDPSNLENIVVSECNAKTGGAENVYFR